MGLAERFKGRLETKNIFQSNNIKFISTPVEENSQEVVISTDNEEIFPTQYSFENIESEIISKIRKTPYWEEYSLQRQEHMIESYFSKKAKDYTQKDKDEFVKNILSLANNR